MSSQTGKLLIAICLLVPLLVVLNVGLWTALRRRNNPNRTRMIQQARASISHPWQAEDQNLKELSDRVAGIRKHTQPAEGSEPDEGSPTGNDSPEDRP